MNLFFWVRGGLVARSYFCLGSRNESWVSFIPERYLAGGWTSRGSGDIRSWGHVIPRLKQKCFAPSPEVGQNQGTQYTLTDISQPPSCYEFRVVLQQKGKQGERQIESTNNHVEELSGLNWTNHNHSARLFPNNRDFNRFSVDAQVTVVWNGRVPCENTRAPCSG